MINKEELFCKVNKISYDILDEIVSPITGIPSGSIWADIFIADLGMYIMGDGGKKDKEQKEKILTEICKKYNIKSLSKKEFISPISTDWPLALIALYIILDGEVEHFVIDKKDLFKKEEE